MFAPYLILAVTRPNQTMRMRRSIPINMLTVTALSHLIMQLASVGVGAKQSRMEFGMRLVNNQRFMNSYGFRL